jgi:hypothetical protein
MRMKQSNLVGPAGFVSMEDGCVGGFVQRGVAGAEDEQADAGAALIRVKVTPKPMKPVKLSQEVLVGALGKLGPKLNGCGAKFPEQRDLLQGSPVNLSFAIQKSGRMSDVKLDPPVQGGALEKCVAEVLAQNPLPPNDGNPRFSKLRVPLRFEN